MHRYSRSGTWVGSSDRATGGSWSPSGLKQEPRAAAAAKKANAILACMNRERGRIKVRWRSFPTLSFLPHLFFFCPRRPQNGSMILYNRKKVKYRKDGYCWKKRKDGKTTREDHMKLKVQGVEVGGSGANASPELSTKVSGTGLAPPWLSRWSSPRRPLTLGEEGSPLGK
uniref:CG-1 domain-containing protein n=1 Tax=Pseudonaja textilis TaxID=8673 RepID=A0A670Z958_PSETE